MDYGSGHLERPQSSVLLQGLRGREAAPSHALEVAWRYPQQGWGQPPVPEGPPSLAFRRGVMDPSAPLRAADGRQAGSPAPRPSPGPSAARQHSSRSGQRGWGDSEWEPLFVSTEKVLTGFLCRLHGNRPRR